MAIITTEMEQLKNKTTAPDQIISLTKQATQRLTEFKTRITTIHDELTALSSMIGSEASFTTEQKNEVAGNLAEIIAIKTAVDKLSL